MGARPSSVPGRGDRSGGIPRVVVRAPNHLGDLVLALPALRAAGADVVVRARLAPLLALALPDRRVVPLRPGASGFAAAVRELRGRGYGRGILLTRALSAALLFRAGGVGALRGTPTDGRRILLREVVPLEALRGRHRARQYLVLAGGADRELPAPPWLAPPPGEVREWRERLGAGRPRVVGIFPGTRAPSRRWLPGRFGEVARRLVGPECAVAVFGGPGEEELTRRVAAAAPGSVDLGGRTGVRELAAALASLDLLVTNDSGPMHLAAAVGTPTLSLWGPGDPRETGALGRGHRRIRHDELGCVPCVKNRCPRSGRGDILPEARGECLALITVEEVVREARELLEEVGGRGRR